ncbi:ATP-binding protein [Streptomyces sp. NPDC002073]
MSGVREQRFPKALVSVRDARQFVGDALAGWGVAERWGDIRFCASELAANAVRHGVPRGREFSVRIGLARDCVSIEVRDSGPGVPVARKVDVGAVSGRGRWLVQELADDLVVLDQVVGKSVWVAFRGLAVPQVKSYR